MSGRKFFKDRIVAYKKGKIYLAVSLEFDLLAEGETIKEAIDRLYDATVGYLQTCSEEKEEETEIYRKAPKKYQELYKLFVELSEKKRKKEEEKKREQELLKQEMNTAQRTYSSQSFSSFCYA